MKYREFVKLALRAKSADDKVTMGTHVHDSMLDSSYFANPDPPLAFIKSTSDDLFAAIVAATDGTKLQQSELVVALNAWDRMMNRVGGYVQNIADADPDNAASIIQSAGLQLRKLREKKPLPSYAHLSAKFTYIPGTIKLLIKGGQNARLYDIYMTGDKGKTWTLAAQTSKRTIIIKVPASQTLYGFKVTPYSTAGRGPDSGVASQIAL